MANSPRLSGGFIFCQVRAVLPSTLEYSHDQLSKNSAGFQPTLVWEQLYRYNKVSVKALFQEF